MKRHLVCYVGDELSAAGFRLAGAATLVTDSFEASRADERDPPAAPPRAPAIVSGSARGAPAIDAGSAAFEQVASAQRALALAMSESALVLVSAATAKRLPAPVLERALAGVSPLVMVVPDPLGRAEVPDIAVRLREQLGLEG